MRELDLEFMAALKKGGILHPVLQRIWKDRTLDLQIRSNEVHIYYRGGRLLNINRNATGYYCGFDTNYINDNEAISNKFPSKMYSENDAHEIVKTFPELKQAMDFYFVEQKDKSEREFQQLIVRENNYSILSNATDYFIVDVEYDAPANGSKKARFDLLAIKWESDGKRRQDAGLKSFPPKLAICELKYYTQALEGKSGLIGHVEDVANFVSSSRNIASLKQDALTMFKQKRELELVKFGAGRNNNPVETIEDSIELILMFANYDPECSKLAKALTEIQPIEGLEVKVAVANFLGYGLYKESVYGISEFKNIFRKQIYCKACD